MLTTATITHIGELKSGTGRNTGLPWKYQDVVLVIPEEDGMFNSITHRIWTEDLERFQMSGLGERDQIRVDVRFRNTTRQKQNGEYFTVCEVFIKSWEAL